MNWSLYGQATHNGHSLVLCTSPIQPVPVSPTPIHLIDFPTYLSHHSAWPHLVTVPILRTEQLHHLLLSCQVLSVSLQPQWTAACQPHLSSTISWSLLKFISIEFVMPSNHLILCHSLLLLLLIFPSFRVFSSESDFCIRWPKFGASALAKSFQGIVRVDLL